MSTLPRDSSNAADAEHHAPVMPASQYGYDFDEAVREFQAAAEWLLIPPPSRAELRDLCLRVAALTADLFPGELAIKVKNDPEIHDDLYFVIGVCASGGIDDVADRDDEWHRRLRRAIGASAKLFCLSIGVR